MSRNKKIIYGDNLSKSKQAAPPPAPAEGRFTFDRNDITFDTMSRTFDEN